MPLLTIDGREIAVEAGTRLIQAADRLGIDIPRFCYHPGLSVAANCRMCLVATNRSAKPVPSCHELCQDGLVVTTASPGILEARRAVLEFLLLHHPVDCPVCDQAGECELQDLYFAHDCRPSRHAFHKVRKPKARAIGPQVVLDAERCINCTRCVRFCTEIAGAPQLQQVSRAETTYVDVFPGRQLDHAYSMCCADVCPVGALTTRDFRFKCRVWFLAGTDSTCGECSRGCAIRVDTYRGRVQRVVPRPDPAVNRFWACDAGRLAYHRFESGRPEKARQAGTTPGYGRAVSGFAEAMREVRGRIGVVLSPFMTCEDAAAAFLLVLSRDPGARFAIGGRAAGQPDGVLVRADRAPNRTGVEAVRAAFRAPAEPLDSLVEAGAAGDLGAILVFGTDHAGGARMDEALRRTPVSAVLAPLGLPDGAGWAFPTVSPYETEGTWVNGDGLRRKLRAAVPPPGEARSILAVLSDVADRIGAPLPAGGPASVARFRVSGRE
jgi:NADH-quinone oxidoreductase subunit G